MKKTFILLALMAFATSAWAQNSIITVDNETDLRTALSSNSIVYINVNGDNIDVTSSDDLLVSSNKVINLVGCNITCTNARFHVVSGGSLVIQSEYDNQIIGHGNFNGRAIYIESGGSCILQSGTVTAANNSVTNGGVIYNEGTLEIEGGTVSSGKATNGGAIYNVGTLTLNGGNISHCEATNGGAIYNVGELTINEGTITSCTATQNNDSGGQGGGIYSTGIVNISGGSISSNEAGNGAAINLYGGTFTMTGGTISGNSTIVSGSANKKCGGLNITGNAEATMSGGSIADNISLDDDGGVYIGDGSTFTMTGGSITGNSAKNYGGIRVDGTFNMSGGSISGNTATNSYGGLRVNGSGTFNMTGGSISGNTATNHGGIYVNGTLNMTGGSVTGNNATNNYGGIYVSGTLKMSGRPIVMGNLVTPTNGTETTCNVYLPSGKTITVNGAFTTGVNVGITCADGVNTIFTSGFGTNSPDNQTVFSSDNTAYVVTVYSNEAKLVDYHAPGIAASNVPYLNVLEDGNHGTATRENCIKMSEIVDNNPTLTQASAYEGWYLVDENLTFNKRITINGTVNLILADNTTLTANKGIHVPNGATLHIWGQSNKMTDPNDLMGIINAMGNATNYSGIGGNNDGAGAGELHFHGGCVSAIGGGNAAGINGLMTIEDGEYGVYIYGGNIFGFGGDYGAGIGSCREQICGSIKITGGVVLGSGGIGAAGIGSGYEGKMQEKDDWGSGYAQNPGGSLHTEIRITGGNVTGWGTLGAGIGGGQNGDHDVWGGEAAIVYIDGGEVFASTLSVPRSDQSIEGMHMNGACAIGWGEHGPDGYNYVHIYNGAKILATTAHDGTPTLQTEEDGRGRGDNWRRFKKMRIVPCDHPGYTPITYTDNGNSLSVVCDYCLTKEPYTFQSAGNWNDASHWLSGFRPDNDNKTGNNVAVKAAATIPASCTANVGNIDMQEGGSLTIADGGQLIHSNAGVVATVKKIITGHEGGLGGGWNFIASPISTPVNPSTIGLITDDFGNSIPEGQTTTYDLYYYDEPNVLWKNYRNASFDLNSGQGYLYANNAGTTLSMTGTLQPSNETVTISGLSHSASTLTGWNLVGNPFACNATIDKPCYTLSGAAINTTANTANTYQIAPCEAVMVQADDMNESVTFTRVEPASQASQPNNGNMRIMLSQVPEPVEGPARHQDGVSPLRQAQSSTALLDNAIVSFNEGEQLGKFYFGEQSANIYIPQGDKEYAIAYSDKQGEMPLNFKATEDGQYTITVNPEGVEMAYLHLIDNMTGADVDLLAAGPSTGSVAEYTFTAKTTDYENRFKLVFGANGEDGPSTGSGTFAFISDGNIIVNGTGTLQVIDLLGRQLSSQVIHSAFRIHHSAFPTGVYVLRLINGNDVKVQKIVVR